MKKRKIYLSLGSNIGIKELNLVKAILKVEKLDKTSVRRISSFYVTKPVGSVVQDDFVNCAILIDSELKPFELLKEINKIEAELGRIRTIHWGPRIVDIDIIFYENISIKTTTLTLPHKEYTFRNFVMKPLYEIMNKSERALFLKHMDNSGVEIANRKCVIGVSSCLCGINSKYSGLNNYAPIVKKLSQYVTFVPFCPEQLGGMETPREKAEIVGNRVVTESGKDVTLKFQAGAFESKKILDFSKCEMAILKSRSPSCGIKEIYDGTFSGKVLKKSGITAELLRNIGYEIAEI